MAALGKDSDAAVNELRAQFSCKFVLLKWILLCLFLQESAYPCRLTEGVLSYGACHHLLYVKETVQWTGKEIIKIEPQSCTRQIQKCLGKSTNAIRY